MKAILRRTYGPSDNLKLEDISEPEPGSREVRVKVVASTVNRTDCALLTGKPLAMRLFIGLFKPKRLVPGTDLAGVVEKTGKDVLGFQVGDRVMAFYDEGLQSHAEQVVLNEAKNILVIPEGITFTEATAALEGGHYAYSFLKKAKLNGQEKILLNGATGGIGSALLQFLKADGHWVTAVANTKNIDLIRSLGADRIYDYEKEDFTKDEDRYDVVLDAVGKSNFGHCRKLLKKGGKYLSSELGPGWQNIFLALLTPLFGSKKVVFPMPDSIANSMDYIKERLSNGTFKPVIDRTYKPQDIADAYSYVCSGQKTGNVVIDWTSI